ncbi:azoreductase [Thalassovita gelatinovora]|uniref:Azoreductase n=1 Tax=Thalassovita gelatinovora TaxID=53501 RepID=A0A0N7LUJ2_THAGE|nr:NAD(P)H-dependent oxidoreductase [Thalassovita gelatinovora]QIZ79179.1 flavodoxin family protein [Thalassovita gelatinovora]CUH63650.1 azoreductase [Thalassovita gelatinovora]SER00960.1 Putative NADPH-quinone reductase (modulator of drug activity B) [Thalassovita gelatinovora]
MKVHVIYAHPLEDSLAGTLHKTVVDSLTEAGHQVDDLNLYAEHFDPVLSAEDRKEYHDVSINRIKVAAYVDRLESCDALVLCHPVWNFGWPAILKGYFDRIFLPDVSFKLRDGELRPGLTNIKKLATVTTYGAKRHRAFVLGDPPRKNGTRFLRVVCDPRVKVQYHALYDMNNVTEARAGAFIKKVRQAMLKF